MYCILVLKKLSLLYKTVVEIDERVTIPTSEDPESQLSSNFEDSTDRDIVRALTDPSQIKTQLQSLYDAGFCSIAIMLLYSYMFPHHGNLVADLAHQMGFAVSVSSKLQPMVKISRANSAIAEAYLSPVTQAYIKMFSTGFEGGLKTLSNKLLFIMDVSQYSGKLEHVFETTTVQVTILAPSLDVSSIAAGGGSRLFWENGMFVGGPESAGAHPGPVCYCKGGPLAVTDANLLLGRLLPKTFLTEARGFESASHNLVVFGGAGGQHRTAIASSLGISCILIPCFFSILSAYGMALADVVVEAQEPSVSVLNTQPGADNTAPFSELRSCAENLIQRAIDALVEQGFPNSLITTELSYNSKRETLIADYMLFRDALHALGALDEVKWQPLTEKDTFRNSTEKHWTPGDSQIAGGLLFEHGNVGEDEDKDDEGGDTLEDPIFNINDLKYLDPNKTQTEQQSKNPGVPPEGWIWSSGRLKNMSATEIEAWEETSTFILDWGLLQLTYCITDDRIQWFRAEANFEFAKDRDSWATITAGHVVYTKEHADMFESLHLDVEMKFRHAQLDFLMTSAGETLADCVLLWRANQETAFGWASRPAFVNPTIHVHGGDTCEPPSEDEADDDTPTWSNQKLHTEEPGVV
ncbi:hypothetical protein BT96DRAFT_1063159 [Gymnopus androsaceus JB14]|uniref:Uncharacterized protein n=1 Tax=Gymnopus androsaceus JB14 TaxID=1447944 RepID=A0A6A4H0F3_9AGAR|nr:hypothetical protein BT96DRAFT_1063159 [Gymnopus androsaceus JB14]